jgi:hypothetical protein
MMNQLDRVQVDTGQVLPRRKARLGKLALDHTQPRPHDVGFFTAVAVPLVPIGTADAIVIAGALQHLGESRGLVVR